MLELSYKTQEEIPEGLRDHYEEKDGAWVLQGFVAKAKLDEFRENNRNLATEKTALQDQLLKFKDIDPEKYAEAVSKLQELENDRLAEAGEWKVLKAKLDQQHVDEMKVEKDKALAVQVGWNAEKIANQTAMIVTRHAIPAEGNMKYVQSDILSVASIDPESQEIVFLGENGLPKKNEAGDANLGLEEYLSKTYIPASQLFQKSEGGGALGGTILPMTAAGEVPIERISGVDIAGSTIENLATGKLKAV